MRQLTEIEILRAEVSLLKRRVEQAETRCESLCVENLDLRAAALKYAEAAAEHKKALHDLRSKDTRGTPWYSPGRCR